jgi:hypothetical protein
MHFIFQVFICSLLFCTATSNVAVAQTSPDSADPAQAIGLGKKPVPVFAPAATA